MTLRIFSPAAVRIPPLPGILLGRAMEPVKGGNLVNLPEAAKAVLDDLHGGSPASYAIRFAAGFPGMMMVLSGMSDLEQMQDNLSYMQDFKPLDEVELSAVGRVQEIFKGMNLIPCTACRYCTDGCPKQIAIPDLFPGFTENNVPSSITY